MSNGQTDIKNARGKRRSSLKKGMEGKEAEQYKEGWGTMVEWEGNWSVGVED